jgi:hypothetical protein
VVAVCLTEGLTYPELVASGVWLGGALLFLGLTGLVELCRQLTPLCCVRGLQLGLGLKTFNVALGLVCGTGGWWTGQRNLDGYGIGLLSACVALLSYGHARIPSSLVLFALGVLGVVLTHPPVALEATWPLAPVPEIPAEAWSRGLLNAALPQLPVSLLNAVVATARLSEDLYPERPARVNRLSTSIGLMDFTSAWFGHLPSCHGCGGLAGQHLFGARTGSSMALMGGLKMGLALALGGSLLPALEAFPKAVVGVLLALSGLELAVPCRDMSHRGDVAVMLLGAGLVLKLGTGIAFALSMIAAAVLTWTGVR